MSSVVISGDTSGTATLTVAAVAGTPTLTLPTTTDTLVGKATTDTLTNKTLTSPTITGVATFAAGSAALPAIISTTGTADTGLWFPAADTLAASTGGTERMRIDSSGNVGIGTTSPGSILAVLGSDGTGFTGLTSTNSNTNIGIAGVQFGSDPTYVKAAIGLLRSNANGVGSLVFYNDSNTDAANWATTDEKMRIDTSGNVLFNTTSSSFGGKLSGSFTGLSQVGMSLVDTYTTYTGNYFVFVNSAGGSAGTISHTGATTVAYNTTSDYRLKDNVAPMIGALDKVAALKPVTYKWKSDGSDGQGFIAHELQEVVPDCVTGEKDATREEEYEVTPAVPAVVDADGVEVTPAVEAVKGTRTVPSYQGVDTSFLVATLVASIQELKAIVDTQATRIAALENTP